MKFQRPKGTVDYFPEKEALKQTIFCKYHEIARKYGYKFVESPAFENYNVLAKEESEEIRGQLFTLTKRGSEDLALRFELTRPLARMFLNIQKEVPKPVKWAYAARMWRYERPQKGRLREFYQLGLECFGSSSPQADAEVIQLIIDFLKSFGLSNQDFIINLNNRKLLEGILQKYIKEEKMAEAMRLIDKREKISDREFHDALMELCKKDHAHLIELLELVDVESLDKLELNKLAKEGRKELEAVYALVDKKYVKLDLTTVRGLGYYTGNVFEVFDLSGKYRSICGGGRYDDMVKMFGGVETPAVGFAIGLSTLQLLLEEKKKLPKTNLEADYYIAIVHDSVREEAAKIASKLRKKFNVEVDLMGKSLGSQLGYAEKIGAKKVVIVGPKDLERKEVTVRDMKTGKETKKKISSL